MGIARGVNKIDLETFEKTQIFPLPINSEALLMGIEKDFAVLLLW